VRTYRGFIFSKKISLKLVRVEEIEKMNSLGRGKGWITNKVLEL
jgi:hypothetical protein